MNEETIRNEVIGFIENELVGSRVEESIREDDDLLGTGLLDSMGIMRLVSHLESRYGIAIGAEEIVIENFINARSISKFIANKRS